MNKNEEEQISESLRDFPEDLAKLIYGSLDTKDLSKKFTSRETLVNKGKTIIPQIHKLLVSENDSLRMEAAKITELIGDRRSIPELLRMLDDSVFDIRWIASEGLINIGRQSICPLIKSVRDGRSSFFFNKGAHHILLVLLHESERNNLIPLLQSLDNYHELGETAPVQASIALNTVVNCNA